MSWAIKGIDVKCKKQTQLFSLCEVLGSIFDNVTGQRRDRQDPFKLHYSKQVKTNKICPFCAILPFLKVSL